MCGEGDVWMCEGRGACGEDYTYLDHSNLWWEESS